MKRLSLALLICLGVCGPVLAINAESPIADPEQRELYDRLTNEVRCLVCQNQTIADSNADLAKDLRREVRDMLLADKTDDDIKEFMLERYGDFVLYKPPVKTTTVPLWIGPFILLAIGLVVVAVMVHRRSHQAQLQMNTEDAERARKLLDEPGREQQS